MFYGYLNTYMAGIIYVIFIKIMVALDASYFKPYKNEFKLPKIAKDIWIIYMDFRGLVAAILNLSTKRGRQMEK